jgi:Domain of unknown function (DUF4062)
MAAGGGQDRRYQVFISSTFIDLKAERQEVIQALLELDCFPAGMELFPASNDERWELIKQVIDDSDYYLVVVGGRYGSVDESGISYTEKEYDYAVSKKKPVIGFLHAEPGEIPSKFTESDPGLQAKLDLFRAKVGQRMCKMWRSPEELGSMVSRSVVKLMKSHPAEGWVRASGAVTPEYIEEVESLRRRVAEYEAERERTRTTAPPGTEHLARGDDPLVLTFFYTHYPDGTGRGSKRYREEVSVGVDDMFSAVGPAMFDEGTEAEFEDRLLRLVLAVAQDSDLMPDEGTVRSITLLDEDIDVARTQLVALRLIEKSDKRHGVNDQNRYWKLTPYGETHLTTLLAVRKPDTPSEG